MRHAMFEHLRSLALPWGDYAIFGSGPLLARGLIDDAGDLDVLVRGSAWSAALAFEDAVHLREHGIGIVDVGGGVTVGRSWGIGKFDVDELIDTADVIDGLPFVRLEHVVAYKRIADRPKDRRHLGLLATAGMLEDES